MGASQSTPTPPPTAAAATPPPGCPMHTPTPSPAAPPPGCPMHESNASNNFTPPTDAINPINNIPALAQAPAPGQKMFLPLERTISSIPRAASATAGGASACPVAHGTGGGAEAGKEGGGGGAKLTEGQWEYPSPQQFYNALVRKGWETPEESIEMMVNIHNWLNEEAWYHVRKWEEKYDGGDRSSLASFSGRPQDISPKARYHMMMGKLFPAYYGSLKPFDRHDWVVHRPTVAEGSSNYTAASPTQAFTSHRYVIDYYALPDDEEGNPVFSLDVRPAVDSLPAVRDRVLEWARVKREAWGGAGEGQRSEGGVPGVRVQEGQ